jgi:RNase H-like domain found in reverse transcriptase/Integrase zinc binding domain/Reverse transcriptase (RNA-dependent DNA polymerase)
MELLYKAHGPSLRHNTSTLPPRDDIITFHPEQHQQELENNIRWHQCPEALRDPILDIIKSYWDVFCEEGLRRNIRGYTCRIDTGAVSPVCCKPPRYGPHESIIMNKLVHQLQQNGLIEDDDGPWGALIVLAAKHGQENTPWHDYIWRLCVSYRRLNQITRPFKFPIPRCDDAVMDISPRAKYFISFDLDSGYWQISLEPTSRSKTAFFTPSGKKRWTVMPMGSLNAMSIFVAMMTDLQTKWNRNATLAGLHGEYGSNLTTTSQDDDYGSAVIADDVTLYATKHDTLLKYFRIVLNELQHHRVTIKLKKCNFLSPTIEFVGIKIGPTGNSPASSKFDALRNLPPPSTWSDLRRAIGFIGFYQQWIQQFEIRLAPFRKLQHRQPLPGELTLTEEQSFFKGFWLPEHERLFRELIEEVIRGPTLQRPDPSRRYYVKTDWCKDGIGAVLLQPDTSATSQIAEDVECQGGQCNFDLTRSGLRLRPISFLSRKTTTPEQSYHSYVGEASAGRWAFSKWRKHLFGKEFTWLTDCNGLRHFFEDTTELANHMLQRWRAELLLYNFTIEHRPASMLTECDMLSRYNTATAAWPQPNPTQPDTFPQSHTSTNTAQALTIFPTATLVTNPTPQHIYTLPKHNIHGDPYWPRATTLNKLLTHRNILVHDILGLPITEALHDLGLTRSIRILGTEHLPPLGPTPFPIYETTSFYSSIYATTPTHDIDWFIATYPGLPANPGHKDTTLLNWLEEITDHINTLISTCQLQLAILFLPIQFPNPSNAFTANSRLPPSWGTASFILRNCSHGGAIETDHFVICATENNRCRNISLPPVTNTPTPMASLLQRESLPTINTTTGDLTLSNPTPAYKASVGSPHQAIPVKLIKNKVDVKPIGGWPIFDSNGPGPSIATARPEQPFFQGLFAVWYHDIPACYPINTKSVFILLGLHPSHITMLDTLPPTTYEQRCRTCPGKEGLKALIHTLIHADTKQQHDPTHAQLNPTHEHNSNAMIILPDTDLSILPLPDEHSWQQALHQDPDTALLIHHITTNTPLDEHHLADKTYYAAYQKHRLDVEDGILRYYEHSHTARLRQLSLKVVPERLRRIVIVACHSSPFGGHIGITKTLFRIQTRFWWPGMLKDIREGIRGCAHCNLSNATSHEASLELHTLACDTPFDTVFLDIWSPGDITDKDGTAKVLTLLDGMTSFAMGAFLQDTINSETIANAALAVFFTTIGLPRLIIVDADSIFAGTFKQLFSLLMIPIHQVARENHKAIRNERFHRYLNKVQRINTSDTGSLFRWKQGVLFALYSWNASPIDGTDISRSSVAIGRDFPFPIDIEGAINSNADQGGQSSLDHHESASPLLYRQRAILNILNSERRLRHIEMRNINKTTPSFAPGDIVIVRKQVKSDASKGISAKLVFRTKGPYRVIEQITPSSYHLQKLPFLQGLGVRGKLRKESAARMTKLPSTLVIHKRANGADTRFSQLNGPFEQMPLQKWLRANTDPGAYTQTTQEHEYAFEPLRNMWSDHIDDASDGDDSSTDDNTTEQEIPPHTNTDSITTHESPTSTPNTPNETTGATQHTIQDHNTLTFSNMKWPPQQPIPQLSTTKVLNRLYRDVCDSTDKMFFIKGAPPSPAAATDMNSCPPQPYSLVEVVWNATNPSQAKVAGLYKVRLWTQCFQDQTTRSLSQSRFYPALQQHHQPFIKYYPARPDKVKQILENDTSLTWPLFDAPLAEVRIIGPFNFSQQRLGLRGPKRQAISESHHIDQIYWQQLEHTCGILNIPTENIWTIPNTPTTTPSEPQPHPQESIPPPTTGLNHTNTHNKE